jgi:hypothetical protein
MELPMFAIVEQMGQRRFGAHVEEADVLGEKMLKCTTLLEAGSGAPPIVTYVHPKSLYAFSPCTEAQARRANVGWGSYVPPELRALPAGAAEPVAYDAEHGDSRDADD